MHNNALRNRNSTTAKASDPAEPNTPPTYYSVLLRTRSTMCSYFPAG